MQSKMTPEGIAPEETDPHDIFVIEPDVVLAARVDQPLAEPSPNRTSPAPKEASPVEDIMGDILSRPSTPKLRVVPDMSVAAPVRPAKPARPVDTPFRATAATADAIANEIKIPGDIHPNVKPPRGAWAKRAAFGFLFALGSVAAAEGWDRYGDTARQMIADWTPALAQLSSQPAVATAPQPTPPAVEAAVTDQTPAPPAPAAMQPAPDAAASIPAAPPPSAQTLQSMTGDLAAMGQQIEELKASIAQLKAGQEQMAQQISRDVVKNAVARNAEAKASEARPPEHPHVLGQPPRPLQPPMRKPPHDAYAPPPTSAAMNLPPPPYPARPPIAAPSPMQPIDSEAPDGGPVVRPPMPLH
jgi:hypothetical protein